jgi:hypothetical protein
MRVLTIHMLPGETPYQAIRRVKDAVDKAFNVDTEMTLTQTVDGATHVQIDLFADVVELGFYTEETWKTIRANIQAVADRALRGDGG